MAIGDLFGDSCHRSLVAPDPRLLFCEPLRTASQFVQLAFDEPLGHFREFPSVKGVGATPFLACRDVNVVRGGRTALDRLNLTLGTSEHVAILGPNGAGKSTLLKLIHRELYPRADGGEMRLFGASRWDVTDLRSRLGVVTHDLQRDIPPTATALDVVIAGFLGKHAVFYPEDRTPERIARAEHALVEAEALRVAERPFGELSSGEARRVLVARALAHDPEVLVLDEPTTSLDLRSREAFLATMRRWMRRGRALVLVTHHLEEIVPEIDRVVMLRSGRVFYDGPRHEAMTSANVGALFGMPLVVEGTGPYRARSVS